MHSALIDSAVAVENSRGSRPPDEPPPLAAVENRRTVLRLLLQPLLCFALSLAVSVLAAPRVLDAEYHHLGIDGLPEWQEFEKSTPQGRDLHVTFSAPPEEAEREATLFIRQRDVKVTWHVTLNGQRIGTLETLSQPLVRALAIPAGLIKAGDNRLTISRAPSRMVDDIVIEEIAFDPRPRAAALGAATLSITVTDADSNSAIPCRLTLVDARSALAPLHAGSGGTLAVRTGVVYTADGRARLGVPPGDYILYANRGFEYSTASQRIVIESGGSQDIALQIRREVPTPGLIAADTHIHTLTHSKHGDATIAERMITIAGEGIELAVATDHNHHTDFTGPAREVGVSAHFRSVVGNEVTTKVGHFNAFPVRAEGPRPDAQIVEWPHLLEHIRSVTGAQVITLNHPRDTHSGFMPFGPENFDATTGELLRASKFECDAIEVITSAAMHSDPMLLFRDWFALLNRGHRVAAIAASDAHDVSQFILGQARTYVASQAADLAAIDVNEVCANFRAGRLLMSFGLLADMRVNERFAVGDLATELGDELRVAIEVSGPSWVTADRIELFANGTPVRELCLSPTVDVQKAKLTFTLRRPRHDVHLVAIATGPGVAAPYWETPRPYQATSRFFNPRVIGATNPIWIDGDGDGKFSAAREQAAALLARFGADQSALNAALADSDAAVRTQAADLQKAAHAAPPIVPGSREAARAAVDSSP